MWRSRLVEYHDRQLIGFRGGDRLCHAVRDPERKSFPVLALNGQPRVGYIGNVAPFPSGDRNASPPKTGRDAAFSSLPSLVARLTPPLQGAGRIGAAQRSR